MAVWHLNHRHLGQSFTSSEVKAMLVSKDFEGVPGFQPGHQAQLEPAFREWLAELQADAS